jgi:hypothetical protein
MQSSYDDNIVETIECVHGNNFVFERKGRAHGEYATDISPWVIGWLVGREVFPDEVQTTNALPAARSRYEGAYVSLANASETAVWWAERIDKIAAYEAEHYQTYRPISVSSWPTLDAIHHPTEGSGASEDSEELELATLDTHAYPAGYFASYHAYPYYPDWMSEDPEYVTARDAEGPNSYFGYLQKLRAHYFPKPLVVAEVGVPSSWGNAHYAQSGMNHGGQDEAQQGHDDRGDEGQRARRRAPGRGRCGVLPREGHADLAAGRRREARARVRHVCRRPRRERAPRRKEDHAALRARAHHHDDGSGARGDGAV